MSRISLRKFLLLSTLWTGIFCNYVCYSIIAPFFPQLARKKGLNAVEYSMVFGAYSIAQVIFSMIAGKFLTKIGPKFIIVAGLFLTGGATVLFGCLEHSPQGRVFLALSIVIRMVEGAGFAAYLTSVLAIVVKSFPTNPGYYVGLTETVVTIGMITGPVIGSFLYVIDNFPKWPKLYLVYHNDKIYPQIGGYHTPFTVFGTLIILTSSVAVWTVSTDHDSQSGENSASLTVREYMRILKLPATILAMMCVTLNVVADAFILITLSDHLKQFSLHPLEIGCIYLCLFLSYSFSSPVAGKLADKLKLEYILQCIGSLILVVAFTLIGPIAFLPISPCVWLVTAGLLLKGLGAGPLISCSYSACLRSARQKGGFSEDFRTYSLVSSVISFCIPLGNLIGGFSAGIMLENLGMSLSTTILAFVFTGLAIFCLAAHFLDKVACPSEEKRPTEHTPIYQKDKTLYNGKTTLLPKMIMDSEKSNSQTEEKLYDAEERLSDETTREALNQLFNTILKSQGVY